MNSKECVICGYSFLTSGRRKTCSSQCLSVLKHNNNLKQKEKLCEQCKHKIELEIIKEENNNLNNKIVLLNDRIAVLEEQYESLDAVYQNKNEIHDNFLLRYEELMNRYEALETNYEALQIINRRNFIQNIIYKIRKFLNPIKYGE